MSEKTLDELKSLIEDIKALVLILNQDKLEQIKSKLLKSGSVEIQVYELADGQNTAQDIADQIQKPMNYTRAVLSALRRKGLVRIIHKNGNDVYDQIF